MKSLFLSFLLVITGFSLAAQDCEPNGSFGEAIEIDGQEHLTLMTDNDSELYYHAYYREEGGRVYARNEGTDEFLLYDFNLEVGDIVTAGDPNAPV